MRKRIYRILLIAGIVGITYTVWCKNYSYDIDKAVMHVETQALSKSHTCCAWFVMRAMNSGGCPIGILPAFAYSKVLPWYGFKLVKTSTYQTGDIIVFPATEKHVFGHIAMWNGEQWISDFKQKSMFPAKAYRKCQYQIFRYSRG